MSMIWSQLKDMMPILGIQFLNPGIRLLYRDKCVGAFLPQPFYFLYTKALIPIRVY